MTWAKIDDKLFSDPRMLAVESPHVRPKDAKRIAAMAVRHAYSELLAWSCAHLTDGEIPASSLQRATSHPDPESAVNALENTGLLRKLISGDGWVIVDFSKDQISKDEVTKRVDGNADRQERSRRCRAGDHSKCTDPKWCRALRERREARAAEKETNGQVVPLSTITGRPKTARLVE